MQSGKAAWVAITALALTGCQTGVTVDLVGPEQYVLTVARSAQSDPVRFARLDAGGRCGIRGAGLFVLEEHADAEKATIRYLCQVPDFP